MRGKPLCSRPPTAENRITPADAGKTAPATATTATTGDHPRGCGENVQQECTLQSKHGSPPRMRGKLCQCGLRRPRSRITPADAGKTRLCGSLSARPEDHPRGCGENRHFDSGLAAKVGSPPRMRGKRCVRLPLCALRRITPADAGKTQTLS